MLRKSLLAITLVFILSTISCNRKNNKSDANILFLHHSTGGIIWKGKQPGLVYKGLNKISPALAKRLSKKAHIPSLLEAYNEESNSNFTIEERIFPKNSPYGWNNYPYDYYNIWVKNGGEKPYMEEPTLEMLTKEYQVIVFKHCFPVCYIKDEDTIPNIDSQAKTLANYKVQYEAIKNKLHAFPETKFILFTGAAQVESNISEESAKLAKDFFIWVKTEWDIAQDNIYLWDLYDLQTEGGLYFLDKYAASPNDSHPNSIFAKKAGQLLFNRIIDVIENDGRRTSLTGQTKTSN
jgi:hypothetical protein